MKISQNIFSNEIQHTNKELENFLALPLTQEYQNKIRSFVTDFSSKSLIQLSLDREEMETRKSELAAVHTLRHIAFLLSTPELHQALKNIQKSSIKWALFVNGMKDSINRKKASNTLNEFIEGFTEFLKVDNQIIRSYLDQEDYKLMFSYLVENTDP
jgi:hypothetical protein